MPPREAVTEQHSEQAGADEARGETAEQSAAEHAAAEQTRLRGGTCTRGLTAQRFPAEPAASCCARSARRAARCCVAAGAE